MLEVSGRQEEAVTLSSNSKRPPLHPPHSEPSRWLAITQKIKAQSSAVCPTPPHCLQRKLSPSSTCHQQDDIRPVLHKFCCALGLPFKDNTVGLPQEGLIH